LYVGCGAPGCLRDHLDRGARRAVRGVRAAFLAAATSTVMLCRGRRPWSRPCDRTLHVTRCALYLRGRLLGPRFIRAACFGCVLHGCTLHGCVLHLECCVLHAARCMLHAVYCMLHDAELSCAATGRSTLGTSSSTTSFRCTRSWPVRCMVYAVLRALQQQQQSSADEPVSAVVLSWL
jgi:hypothetical protein